MTTSATKSSSGTRGRRSIRFTTIDQMLAEAMLLGACERDQTLKSCGTWTVGQTLGHLAAWMSYPYEGYPIKIPFIVRLIMPLIKKRTLNSGMPTGRRLPGVKGGTLAIEVLPLEDGLDRFTRAADRLRRNPPTAPNPLFGKLTHEEWIALNLRHAELHLSFFEPASPAVP